MDIVDLESPIIPRMRHEGSRRRPARAHEWAGDRQRDRTRQRRAAAVDGVSV